jgi:hypothetical protein
VSASRWLALALFAVGCGPATEPRPAPGVTSPPTIVEATAALPSAAAPPAVKVAPPVITDADDPELREILEKVAAARQLPIKEHVKFTTLGRAALLAKTKQKLAEEIPPRVLEAQGEAMRSLGLAPPDYDFVEGLLALLQARIAGFYDPDARGMYLLDDLGETQKEETLPHELVHALQDQSFSIGPLLHFREGQSDKTSALQLLIEGDAMHAGFEVTYGSAFVVDESSLRSAFLYSTKLSEVGARTPDYLVSSLVSPYTDGFSFVQALRSHGGWRAVDAAYVAMPESTEQTLHPEKYFAKERPVTVAAPSIEALGPGFDVVLNDVNGELGLRLVLEQWVARKVALAAAAGWGGDRYVVAKKAGDPPTFAVAFVNRMDTQPDAVELGEALARQIGPTCLERESFGPLAWRAKGKDVVVVAGPYTLGGGVARSAGDCALAEKWSSSILRAR